MNANGLSLLAGAVLALLFSYIPGLNAKFAALESTYKRLLMLGLLVLSAGAIYGMSCAGWSLGGYEVACDETGIKTMIELLIVAVIANQSTFLISPETKKVQEAKM